MSNTILEIEDIKKILPQRYPFLMIDRVTEASAEKVVAIKNVSANEDYFEGHFPEEKVMPGVLILEAMAQTGILLHYFKFKNITVFYLGKIKSKLFQPVSPGDQLIIKATPIKLFSKQGIVTVEALVNDKKVAEAEIGFGIR